MQLHRARLSVRSQDSNTQGAPGVGSRHRRARLAPPWIVSHRRLIGSGLAVVACALALLGALAGTAGATTAPNLLRNGGAESGAASLHGWDAVTIPGWSVAAGLPTVVRYGDRQFPAGRGGQLFAGGAGRNGAPGPDGGPGASGRRAAAGRKRLRALRRTGGHHHQPGRRLGGVLLGGRARARPTQPRTGGRSPALGRHRAARPCPLRPSARAAPHARA